jgi:sulfite reductase (ferredoxin)
LILQINQNEPSHQFATKYKAEAEAFLGASKVKREATA